MTIFLLIVLILFLPWVLFAGKLILLKGKLQRFCEKTGAEIAWLKNPFSAAFFGKAEKICVIKAKEKTYHVTLFSARHRLREYSFVSPREVVIHKKIILKVVGKKRRFAQMEGLPIAASFRSRPLLLSEAVPIGEEKVFLFYPVPAEVTWLSPGKGKRPLGNGDLFWNDYRFFTRSGFFAEISSPGKYLRKIEPWEDE